MENASPPATLTGNSKLESDGLNSESFVCLAVGGAWNEDLRRTPRMDLSFLLQLRL